MSGAKYCSWDVQELATDYGWMELPVHPNDEGKMLSFYSSEHGGVRANVYLKTGTVATCLDHPTQGKTQLFRGQRDTFEKLEEVFVNPRIHTDSGYKTRSKLREEEFGEYVMETSSSDSNEEVDIDHINEEGDAIEQLRSLSIESELNEKDVATDLYGMGRYNEGSEFDGVTLMEKLLNKWDEEEKDGDEKFENNIDQFNDEVEEYLKSVSEVDYSEVASSCFESDSDECDHESDEIREHESDEARESGPSVTDSDQHEADESTDRDTTDENGSQEVSSESDCSTDSNDESLDWSEENSGDDDFYESDNSE